LIQIKDKFSYIYFKKDVMMIKIWKYMLFSLILVGLMSGCTKTWSGVKQDTSKVWKDGKKVVHDATA